VFYVAKLMDFCWRYIAAEFQYRFRCLVGSTPGGWPLAQQTVLKAGMQRKAARLKLRLAANLQWLSW